jgi:hypothetical protein
MLIDNSKCKHGLKALQIKLFRELTVRNRELDTADSSKKGETEVPKVGNEAPQSFTEEIMLIRSIFPGVQSKDKMQCSYEIKLTDIVNDS